uniref:Uncharacterized protein n=1 Tax=Tanacetum cinerariifolium TaxID=118510 RepID=A0A699IC13_TANCI|nr:hypothetical protein [Tanacetum cinerariifolium]
MDFESNLMEDVRGIEELQPLAARTAPPPSDHTHTLPNPTPVSPLTDKEFMASKPSDTRITSSHSIAHQTPPHPEATSLSPSSFRKRYRYSYETPSPSYETPSPSSSLTLPIRKRYRGTSKLIDDTKDESSDLDTMREGLEDGGPGLKEQEEEEASPEGQKRAVPIMDTAADEPLGFGYWGLRRQQQRVKDTLTPRPRVRATWLDHVDGTVYTGIPIDVSPVCVPIQTPPSLEWSSGSLLVSPSSLAVPTPVASPVTTPATTIAVGKDEFLEVGAQLELYGAYYHLHCLRVMIGISESCIPGRGRLRKRSFHIAKG